MHRREKSRGIAMLWPRAMRTREGRFRCFESSWLSGLKEPRGHGSEGGGQTDASVTRWSGRDHGWEQIWCWRQAAGGSLAPLPRSSLYERHQKAENKSKKNEGRIGGRGAFNALLLGAAFWLYGP